MKPDHTSTPHKLCVRRARVIHGSRQAAAAATDSDSEPEPRRKLERKRPRLACRIYHLTLHSSCPTAAGAVTGQLRLTSTAMARAAAASARRCSLRLRLSRISGIEHLKSFIHGKLARILIALRLSVHHMHRIQPEVRVSGESPSQCGAVSGADPSHRMIIRAYKLEPRRDTVAGHYDRRWTPGRKPEPRSRAPLCGMRALAPEHRVQAHYQ
jgi:hypothetical protein